MFRISKYIFQVTSADAERKGSQKHICKTIHSNTQHIRTNKHKYKFICKRHSNQSNTVYVFVATLNV